MFYVMAYELRLYFEGDIKQNKNGNLEIISMMRRIRIVLLTESAKEFIR